MPDAKAAWEEVGSLFSALGLKLKEHFAQAASGTPSFVATRVGYAEFEHFIVSE